MIHRHGLLNVYGNMITTDMCEGCKEKEFRHFSQELNGKKIAYNSKTEFLVQVGKGKSSYKTRYKFIGNLTHAVSFYNGINIGNGYKKRLVCFSMNKPVLARQFS